MCNTIVEGHQPTAPPVRQPLPRLPECGLRHATLTVKIRLDIYIYIYIYIM